MQKEQNTEESEKEKKNSEPLVNRGVLPRSASLLSRKHSSDYLLVSFQSNTLWSPPQSPCELWSEGTV